EKDFRVYWRIRRGIERLRGRRKWIFFGLDFINQVADPANDVDEEPHRHRETDCQDDQSDFDMPRHVQFAVGCLVEEKRWTAPTIVSTSLFWNIASIIVCAFTGLLRFPISSNIEGMVTLQRTATGAVRTGNGIPGMALFRSSCSIFAACALNPRLLR